MRTRNVMCTHNTHTHTHTHTGILTFETFCAQENAVVLEQSVLALCNIGFLYRHIQVESLFFIFPVCNLVFFYGHTGRISAETCIFFVYLILTCFIFAMYRWNLCFACILFVCVCVCVLLLFCFRRVQVEPLLRLHFIYLLFFVFAMYR